MRTYVAALSLVDDKFDLIKIHLLSQMGFMEFGCILGSYMIIGIYCL